MQTAIAKRLAMAATCCALWCGPSQAGEDDGGKGRAGLDGLSRQMSICAAYFSLLSGIIENATDPGEKTTVARRVKSIGQAMAKQAINVASHIGVADSVPTERVEAALKEMVETINRDPANSLSVMHARYGLSCDALLKTAPQPFKELLKQYETD